MHLTFNIKPTIQYYENSEKEDLKETKNPNKIDKILLDEMVKDILSKKFRVWYSSIINKTVTKNINEVDNYLNVKIAKISKTGNFKFTISADLNINYNGKYKDKKDKKDKNFIDNLMTVQNIRENFKLSSWWHYIHSDSYRRYQVLVKSKKENNKLVTTVDMNLNRQSADFVILQDDLKNFKLYKD